jgi:hypothetical protein
VISATAILRKSVYTCLVDRLTDEAEYVVAILHRMREEVIAHPELFDPDAQERIDKAIASIDEVRQGVKAA